MSGCMVVLVDISYSLFEWGQKDQEVYLYNHSFMKGLILFVHT